MEEKPLYKKLVYTIEDDILNGKYKEGDIIISTTKMSEAYNVNSTTAMKAITILRESGVIQKKRGVGMAVSSDGKAIVKKRRTQIFMEQLLPQIISEAEKLEISKKELVGLIVERGSC